MSWEKFLLSKSVNYWHRKLATKKRNLSRVDQKWTKSGPRAVQKRTKRRPKADQNQTTIRPKADQKRTKSGPKVDQERTKSRLKVDQKQTKADQKWTQWRPKPNHNWSIRGPKADQRGQNRSKWSHMFSDILETVETFESFSYSFDKLLRLFWDNFDKP